MKRIARLAICGVLATACASISVKSVGSPRQQGKTVASIAIAPLLNRTRHAEAGRIIAELLAVKLTAAGGVRVVELPPEIVIDPERLDRTRAQELATKVKADGLLVGTVFAYDYGSDGGARVAPTVRVDLRLVDAASGSIVWLANAEGQRDLALTNDSMPVSALADEIAARLANDLASNL